MIYNVNQASSKISGLDGLASRDAPRDVAFSYQAGGPAGQRRRWPFLPLPGKSGAEPAHLRLFGAPRDALRASPRVDGWGPPERLFLQSSPSGADLEGAPMSHRLGLIVMIMLGLADANR